MFLAISFKPEIPPNVVLIYFDDMGYGDISVTGAIDYQTPNFDKLAHEGVFFSQFYSPQAVCSASRAGLLTGCYPNRIGFSGALDHTAKIGLNPEETTEVVNAQEYDYVLDCIDSVTPKLHLIKAAKEKGCKIISSMGAGGKVDSMKIHYADISKTHMCPFAYYIRKRLRKEGINSGVMAVFSHEKPIEESIKKTDGTNFKKSFYGTISYIPALFGLHMASWVIRDITERFEPTQACIPKAKNK